MKATPRRLYDKVNEKYPVDLDTYRELYDRFAKLTKEKLLDGHKWKTQAFGELAIKGQKPTKPAVDWGTTNKMWAEYPEAKERKQLVFFYNKFFYKTRWFKGRLRPTPMVTMYWWRQAETFSDDLTLRIKQGQEYDDIHFRKHKKRPEQDTSGHF